MSKLKIGIIGIGGIAMMKHLPTLTKTSQAEVVALCDIILPKAVQGAEKFGLKDVKIFEDYKELLKLEEIDVVHVCVPNNGHAQITIDALEAGKHVMCEKPMAKTSQEAKEMLAAAKRTGKKLTIGYQNRFREDTLMLKQMCENNDLGDVYYAKARAIRRCAVPTWGVFTDKEKQGGGPLIDIGTHALDITLWMLDKYEVDYVVGTTYNKLGTTGLPANAFGPWNKDEYEVEDLAVGFIKMKTGETIAIEACWALHTLEIGEAQTILYGTKAGADMLDGLRINGQKYGKMYTHKPEFNDGGVPYFAVEDGYDPSVIEANTWFDSIINDTEVKVKPEEALVVTQILEAIYESAQSGQPIYFK